MDPVPSTSAAALDGGANASRASDVPLCVDLDGTLVATDVLVECAVALFVRRPWMLAFVPWWLVRGRAHLKREIARHSPADLRVLPFRSNVLDWLRNEAAGGRTLVLATGADAVAASTIAGRAACFREVLASDGVHNLTGHRKASRLVERFGLRGFDYAGNHRVDLPVWRAARRALVVGSPRFAARAGKEAPVVQRWDAAEAGIGRRALAALKSLRPHQWIKNALVFVPIVAAHRTGEIELWTRAAMAFASFALVASAVYVMNDLADIANDRRHPGKRRRPFASGALPLAAGLALAPAALIGGIAVAAALPRSFGACLLAYFFASTAYTLGLKKVAGLDVLMLAGMYALRLAAGGVVTGIALSEWLIAFAAFLFLSLALIKREAELHAVAREGGDRARGRAYRQSHLRAVRAAGWLAAAGAVAVLAVYVLRPDVTALYSKPRVLWLWCPIVALWLAHLWRRTARGHMHDDPVVFALYDPWSWLAVTAFAGVMAAAT
jgi:4-hydroxybenzoate polyprenyltransferase